MGSCRILRHQFQAYEAQASAASANLMTAFGKLGTVAEQTESKSQLVPIALQAQLRTPNLAKGGHAAEEVLRLGKRHVARFEDITLRGDVAGDAKVETD
eukprot:528447-Amphidinium_carterae.1